MATTLPVLRHERDVDGAPHYLVSFWADDTRYSIGFRVGSELIDAMVEHSLDDRTIESVFGFVNDAVDAEPLDFLPVPAFSPWRFLLAAAVVGVLLRWALMAIEGTWR